jgi:hypothetical protein
VTEDESLATATTVRTGLREVALQDWAFSVNGEPLVRERPRPSSARLDVSSARLRPTELRR